VFFLAWARRIFAQFSWRINCESVHRAFICGVEDAEKLHDELKAHAVAIRAPLTYHPWALEFQVEDPDGNVIRFGSEPR
jgi:hypothetical protein